MLLRNDFPKLQWKNNRTDEWAKIYEREELPRGNDAKLLLWEKRFWCGSFLRTKVMCETRATSLVWNESVPKSSQSQNSRIRPVKSQRKVVVNYLEQKFSLSSFNWALILISNFSLQSPRVRKEAANLVGKSLSSREIKSRLTSPSRPQTCHCFAP